MARRAGSLVCRQVCGPVWALALIAALAVPLAAQEAADPGAATAPPPEAGLLQTDPAPAEVAPADLTPSGPVPGDQPETSPAAGAEDDRPAVSAPPETIVPRAPVAADFPLGTPAPAPPAVLFVNLERIFAESLFGQRVREDLGAAQAALIAENAQIQQTLQEEERLLAERRPTMDVDVFRAEADAFDARVQAIRNEQDAKEEVLQQVLAAGRADFRAAVQPVIVRIMVERGATLVLDHTSVYVAVASVDITQDAIDALDATLGNAPPAEGGGESAIPDPAPDGIPLTGE